jgi:hypothetical protein
MIRVDAVWLAVEPPDMRAGTEAAMARVVRRRVGKEPLPVGRLGPGAGDRRQGVKGEMKRG